jgi:hypothetical protein
MKTRILVLGMAIVLICAGLMVSVGAAAKPGMDFSGEHYNLNIIGKKLDWNGGGSDNNTDRHTMFVPENTSAYTIPVYDEGNYTELSGIKILMTQGSEFAVIDGNAFDDGTAAFQLAPGQYKVFIAAKGKPGGSAVITGWVKCNDTYYFDMGTVKVTKKTGWVNATPMFYVDSQEDPLGLVGNETWVFDYLTALNEYDAVLYPEPLYFWQFDNRGSKLVQVRFYPA